MTICIFPGTFNPIHQAHIKMAKFALDYYGFEKIILIPAYVPPHKDISSNLATHRLNMVKLAVSNIMGLEVSDIEFKMNESEKSYSLLTVKKIREQYGIKGKLNFIIGTDAFTKVDSWYKAEELKELVHFIVFPRGVEISKNVKTNFDYEMAPMDFLDISSTDIRKNNKETIKEVKDYIKQNELY